MSPRSALETVSGPIRPNAAPQRPSKSSSLKSMNDPRAASSAENPGCPSLTSMQSAPEYSGISDSFAAALPAETCCELAALPPVAALSTPAHPPSAGRHRLTARSRAVSVRIKRSRAGEVVCCVCKGIPSDSGACREWRAASPMIPDAGCPSARAVRGSRPRFSFALRAAGSARGASGKLFQLGWDCPKAGTDWLVRTFYNGANRENDGRHTHDTAGRASALWRHGRIVVRSRCGMRTQKVGCAWKVGCARRA